MTTQTRLALTNVLQWAQKKGRPQTLCACGLSLDVLPTDTWKTVVQKFKSAAWEYCQNHPDGILPQ